MSECFTDDFYLSPFTFTLTEFSMITFTDTFTYTFTDTFTDVFTDTFTSYFWKCNYFRDDYDFCFFSFLEV